MHKSPILRGCLALGIAALTLAWSDPVPAVSAASATPSFQALLTGGDPQSDQLYRGVQYSDGSWKGFDNVADSVSVPGSIRLVAAADISGELQVVLTAPAPYPNAPIYYGVRTVGGAWRGFTNIAPLVKMPATDNYWSVAAAAFNGDLHVFVVTQADHGGLYHAIRHSDTGTWTGFDPMPQAINQGQGPYLGVAAATVNGKLHVVVTEGAPSVTYGQLNHGVFDSSGAWSGFTKVVGPQGVPTDIVGRFAAAGVNGNLHVPMTVGNTLYDAVLDSNGGWTFDQVSTVGTGGIGQVAAVAVNSVLHVLITSNGVLYQGTRDANGVWSAFTDVAGSAVVPQAPYAIAATTIESYAFKGAYTLDGYGGLHAAGDSAPMTDSAYWPGWKIARSGALLPGGGGGYVLDGYGGVHSFGSTVTVPTAYFGWDIARDVAFLPTATAASPQGYTLDGFGGVHPFGGAPAVHGGAYWKNWDIAKRFALLSDGTGGYVLDGYGGLHGFAIGNNPMPPSITNEAYWNGWNIARDIALAPGSTAANVAGVTLDGYGGVHPFGNSGAVMNQSAYWNHWDIARAVRYSPDSTAANPKGWVMDGWGGCHTFGGALPLSGAYWKNWDIATQLIIG